MFLRRLAPVLISFVLTAYAGAQTPPAAGDAPTDNRVAITIEVESPGTSAPVYMTGSADELGPWDPAKHRMEGDTGLFYTTLKLPVGTELQYKFTRGAWTLEALQEDGQVFDNFTHVVRGPETIHHNIPMFRGVDSEIPYPEPTRWEADIVRYEEADAQAPPPTGEIVAVGSSSIVHWHPTIAADLAPLTIIPRGFGGSMMNDLLYNVNRIVTKYKPRAVLLYEGDNDIGHGVRPGTIMGAFRGVCDRIWWTNPETRIYVLAIKPSPSRKEFWERTQELNALLADACANDKRLIYLDVATPMLNADGSMRPELYGEDMLHMNDAGYRIWTKVVQEGMVKREAGSQNNGTE